VSLIDRLWGRRRGDAATNCACGLFDVEVVGEASYQPALRSETNRASAGRILVSVQTEPSNKMDRNAVRICGSSAQTLGYLPRDFAVLASPAVARFRRAEGAWPSCLARIVGGRPEAPSLGIWLDLDLFRLGIAVDRAASSVSSGFRTGLSDAVSSDQADDTYDLAWIAKLSESPADIPLLQDFLSHDHAPISRHYLYSQLERTLYRARDSLSSALEDFDTVCEKHDAEMGEIRPALMRKFGRMPYLDTHRQASIRHQKSHDFERSALWAERGIALYGMDAADPLWVTDLINRRDKAASKGAKK
jgi:hypothetical protein